jgi:hypothetical protein
MSGYDDFKQKLGYGARANLFEIEVSVPTIVATAMGKDVKTIASDLKFLVSGFPIPTKKIGDINVLYQGEPLNLAGDISYDDSIAFAYLNDTDYYVRTVIENWIGLIINPSNNARANPNIYKQTFKLWHCSNEVNADGTKKRVKGWKLEGAYPTTFGAIPKAWETINTLEKSDFALKYDKYKRLSATGVELD